MWLVYLPHVPLLKITHWGFLHCPSGTITLQDSTQQCRKTAPLSDYYTRLLHGPGRISWAFRNHLPSHVMESLTISSSSYFWTNWISAGRKHIYLTFIMNYFGSIQPSPEVFSVASVIYVWFNLQMQSHRDLAGFPHLPPRTEMKLFPECLRSRNATFWKWKDNTVYVWVWENYFTCL